MNLNTAPQQIGTHDQVLSSFPDPNGRLQYFQDLQTQATTAHNQVAALFGQHNLTPVISENIHIAHQAAVNAQGEMNEFINNFREGIGNNMNDDELKERSLLAFASIKRAQTTSDNLHTSIANHLALSLTNVPEQNPASVLGGGTPSPVGYHLSGSDSEGEGEGKK